MTGRSRRHSPPLEQDDDAGLAGWLYTDLLLGLAVVFLAGTTFFVPKLFDDDKPAEAVEATTTTTTIPVDLCTSLYAAKDSQDDKTKGIWFTIDRDRQSPENMAAEFDLKLRQQIVEENFSRAQSGLPDLQYEGLRIGLMLVYGGFAADETPEQGQLRARNNVFPVIESTLRPLFADGGGFPASILRFFGTRKDVDANQVGFDVYPYVESPCGN